MHYMGEILRRIQFSGPKYSILGARREHEEPRARKPMNGEKENTNSQQPFFRDRGASEAEKMGWALATLQLKKPSDKIDAAIF